ncbi:MAG: hypothetical protein N2651_01645 [Fimbriimonadales bacterium]|nr:hypothetical protein [Fimbriimonadales bacterium]
MTKTDIDVDALYDEQIAPLTVQQKLRLIAKIAEELASLASSEPCEEAGRRSLLELEGLGAEIWKGIDAQEYVNQLRAEWDHRP